MSTVDHGDFVGVFGFNGEGHRIDDALVNSNGFVWVQRGRFQGWNTDE